MAYSRDLPKMARQHTTPYKVEQEKKNFTMKLPVVNDKGSDS